MLKKIIDAANFVPHGKCPKCDRYKFHQPSCGQLLPYPLRYVYTLIPVRPN